MIKALPINSSFYVEGSIYRNCFEVVSDNPNFYIIRSDAGQEIQVPKQVIKKIAADNPSNVLTISFSSWFSKLPIVKSFLADNAF
jgi:hypothetical protein